MNYYFALVENVVHDSQSVRVGTSDVDEERVAKKNVKNFIPSTTVDTKLFTSRRKIYIDLNTYPRTQPDCRNTCIRSQSNDLGRLSCLLQGS